jgi:two-component system OmpR family response regulator
MTRCLLVDDDREIRIAVAGYLERFGMRVTAVGTGGEMRRAVGAGRFDIVVLDVMLPDDNGMELCKWLQRGTPLPVIMLTAQGDPNSRVLGLELGADDYIGKPFEPRELVARIHAVLRRASKGERAVPAMPASALRFDGWSFDRLRRLLVSPAQVALALSNAEFRLLCAFLDRPGRVLSRGQLIEFTAAPGVDVSGRSIDLAVSRLRQKLGDSSREPTLIRTVRGVGYLFNAEVRA